jgi:rhamnogalacturonan endolyase
MHIDAPGRSVSDSSHGMKQIRCLGLACAVAMIWGMPARSAAGDDVQVVEGAGAITLQNGLVTAVIDKKRATVVSITLPGGHNLVSRGGVTFDAEAFGKGKNEAGIRGGDGIIMSRGPDVAEVKFIDPNFINLMTAEMHFVMTRGMAGIYEYLVMKHGEGQPVGGVGQLRWVFRGDASLLTHAFASASKQGQMIEGDAFQGARTIADATFSLTKEVGENVYREPMGHTYDGLPVYSKYDWTDYAENHVVHGFSSDTEGIFMVQPSMEYYNGGPTKGILTVHNGPVAILEFLGGHFLIRNDISIHLTEGQEWQQMIGPWLVYLNKGGSANELWQDAFRRGQEEKAAWPYAWVQEDETLYPRKRGTVSGVLTIPGQKAANALIVLAAPDKDWQVQTMGYEFWTRADANGSFSVTKVRPGSYALYASVPGVVGEVKVTNVNVGADQTTNLGAIQWNPPKRQVLLWRVGTPDRTTAEFRFGSEPRQFGLWWRYMQEMGTRELNYTVGQSDPARDWYYAQSVVPMPDGSYFSPIWNINFNVPNPPPGIPLRLTVDLAGAAGGHNLLDISVNGHAIGQIDSPNDSGIYRSAVRSADFRHNVIEFDSGLLKPGTNKLTFSLEAKGNWRKGPVESIITTDTTAMPEIPSAGVMYDCIQLEAGPITGDGSYKLLPAPRTP